MAYTGKLPIDEGVTIKASFLNPEIGKVAMVKSQPGVYFDEHGQEVSEAIARLAGFDVVRLARIKYLAEQQAAFHADMMNEYAKAAGLKHETLASRGGFSVVQLANGRADVVDVDGSKINATGLTEAEAFKLFNMLAQGTEDSGDE
ncbi:hypothetical protein [Sinorhizobium fredii]|uniref:hypothetical protein n=1 Tax=Rhizobium fredii TaxID=380 RepID=UPI0004B1C8CB|nr:hypothetical protein [Sinorhizobium fredii]